MDFAWAKIVRYSEVGRMTFLIDHREQPSMKRLVKKYMITYEPDAKKEISLNKISDIQWEKPKEAQLEVGDYADPDNGFAIERKSDDFLPEIQNGAIFQKLQELSQFPKSFLVIDKSLHDIFDDMKKRIGERDDVEDEDVEFENQRVALMGAIASLATRGFPPIFCGTKEVATEFIVRTYFKAKDKKNRSVYSAVRPKAKPRDWALNVLTSFPNIGEKTANKILDKYKSLEKVFARLPILYTHMDEEDMWAEIRSVGLNKKNLKQTCTLLITRSSE